MPNTKPIGVAYEDQQLDGAVLGASGGTIGFYGKTPVVQGAAVTTLATTPTATDIAVAVNSIISRLKTVGLIA
jgi:hypothetical protein